MARVGRSEPIQPRTSHSVRASVFEATLDAANGSFWSGYNPHTTATVIVPAGAMAVVESANQNLHASNAFTVTNSGTARTWTRLNTYAPATDHLVVDYWFNNTGAPVSMTITVTYVNGDGFNDNVMSWIGVIAHTADPAVAPPRIVTTISNTSTAQATGTPSAIGSLFCLHYFQNAPTANVSSLVAGSAVDASPVSTFYFSGGPCSIGTIYQSAVNAQTASPVTVGATLPTTAQTYGFLVEYFLVSASGPLVGTPADPEGITDTATPVQDMVRTQADPEGILDAASPVQGLVRSAADPVGLLDAAAAQQDLVRLPADSVGLLDAASVQQGMARTAADPVGLLDTASVVANNVRLPADPVGLLDAATAQIGAVRQVDDPVGLLDVASPVQGVVRQQDDAVGIVDAVSATLSAEYTGFGTAFPPAGFGAYSFGADSSDVSLGNGIFTSLIGQRCLGARVAIPADATGTTLTGAVAYLYAGGVGGASLVSGYPVLGQLITSASFGTLTIGAWNEVRWATPVNLVQNSLYYIIIWLPGNLYGYIHDIFVGGTDVAAPLGGGLTYVGDTGAHHDGVYGYGGVNHVPENDFRAAWYGADGIFDGASGTSYTKSQDDAVGLLDAASAVLNVVRQQDDPLGIVDTASARQDLVRSAADAVGLLDAASAKQDAVRAQADAVGLLDAATATQGLVRPPADPAGIADAATAVQSLARTQADPVGLTDSATASLGMPRQVDDPIGLIDAASTVIGLQRAPVDPIGITDSVSATLTSAGAVTVTDQIGLIDSASAKLDSVRSTADQVGLLDAASAGLGFIRTATDPIGLSDTVAATQQAARTTADPVAITDALALDRALPMNDPTALTDTVTASLGMNREADDDLGLTDSVAAFLDRVRLQHDPVGISDSVTAVLTPGEIDYVGTPIDSIGLTDSVVAVLTHAERPGWHDQTNGPLIPHRNQGVSSLQWHDQTNTSTIPSHHDQPQPNTPPWRDVTSGPAIPPEETE